MILIASPLLEMRVELVGMVEFGGVLWVLGFRHFKISGGAQFYFAGAEFSFVR